VAASHRRIRKIFKITVAVLSLPRRFAQGNLEPYVERAEIALGASLNLIGNQRSGLRLTFVALLALGFELRVLLRGQDSFSRFHVFGLARIGATRLLMLRHG